MRISFVLDCFGGGGKERRCLQLIQGLNKQGYNDILVVIINDDIAYQELYNTTADVRIIDRKNRGLSFFKTLKEVRLLFKSFKPDIVQTWGGISTLIPILLKPLFEYKLIGAYVADADSPKRLSITNIYPLLCDKIVGNSKIGLDAYRVPTKKGILIYNGFNEKRLNCNIDKKQKKLSLEISTQFVVAMIASFGKNKDWNCYLKAAKHIMKKRQDITFLAVGTGVMWDQMNQKLTESERDNIKMLGRRDDVDELLQICDLTVLTSNHGEGISNSILESMAFGVPVIATNKGGTPEIVSEGENGLLLQENNPVVLADKIIKLINNSEKLQAMSEKAAETIRTQFMLSVMTQRYIDLYKSVC
jgi:glycosyltransferase involved in cell wall biosynthesis